MNVRVSGKHMEIGDSFRSRIGEQVYEWGPKDVFVVPSWYKVSHEADEDAVLFSYSDRPVQKALGLWREQTEA
jgi:gentisate 1,2-dioxygenase